jgi:hypothetical protein
MIWSNKLRSRGSNACNVAYFYSSLGNLAIVLKRSFQNGTCLLVSNKHYYDNLLTDLRNEHELEQNLRDSECFRFNNLLDVALTELNKDI